MIAGEHEAFILSLGDDCAVFFVIDPLYGLENRLEKGERGDQFAKGGEWRAGRAGFWQMGNVHASRAEIQVCLRIPYISGNICR